MPLNFIELLFLIIQNHGRDIRDLFIFLGALYLGEWFQPFAHWLAAGSLPPWIEQLAKVLPGLLVAIWHYRTTKKKNQNDAQ